VGLFVPQADKIAQTLKAVEHGENPVSDSGGKIAASMVRGSFKTGIVMDDKLITLEMPWKMIRDTSEVALAEYILKQMRNQRENA
jgi:hypothetical protein